MRRLLPLLAWLVAGCDSPALTRPETPKFASGADVSRSVADLTSPPPTQLAFGIDYGRWLPVTRRPYPTPPESVVLCAPTRFTPPIQSEAARGMHYGRTVVLRVNPLGEEAFRAGRAVPPGTIVIKEKHAEDQGSGGPNAVAAMTKREAGYDAERGDWEYAYQELLPKPGAEARGKVESCIACHAKAAGSDYLFRPYLPDGK